MGDAKVPTSGTSNSTALTLFFVLSPKGEALADKNTTVKRNYFKSILHKTFFLGIYATSAIFTIAISSCSSTKTIALSCQERHIEIYVDEEYLGRDLVYYTVPKGREYIDVSCRSNGVELYHRRITVKDRNGNLIELQIPKNYKYSNKPY